MFSCGCLINSFSVAAFPGGNGAVDSVPHLLLGGADWTESEEDLRLVGDVLHQVVGFKRSLDFKMSKYYEPDYICINSWTSTLSCEDHDESFGFLFFLASTHRRLPTQRAQLSERRFCGDFRPESKISNQYVSVKNHRVVFLQLSDSVTCRFKKPLLLPSASGAFADRVLLAAAADASDGRPAAVEGARAEV